MKFHMYKMKQFWKSAVQRGTHVTTRYCALNTLLRAHFMLRVLTTEQDKEVQGNFWGVLDMPGTVTVGMVPWLHIYVQTRQIVHIKCVQCFVCQPYVNKAVQKTLASKVKVLPP